MRHQIVNENDVVSAEFKIISPKKLNAGNSKQRADVFKKDVLQAEEFLAKTAADFQKKKAVCMQRQKELETITRKYRQLQRELDMLSAKRFDYLMLLRESVKELATCGIQVISKEINAQYQ